MQLKLEYSIYVESDFIILATIQPLSMGRC